MGRKYAPAYADIYLAHWEETAFHKTPLKPLLYFRICAFPEHVEEATSTLFSALRPRGYSRRFLGSIKAEVGQTFKDKYNTISTQPSGPTLVPQITTYSKDLGSLLGYLRFNFAGADSLESLRIVADEDPS
ncbi:hypothetical protein NQZ68_007236 [Dissostichus eleginoides]|nr:hypothetical protein NQZ68_007236 [Dissostichus eleginoides]